MPVGRNSWQDAMRKAKEKSNPQSSEGPAPVLKRMPDRSPGVVPTRSNFARMTGYFPPATPRYNDGFPRPLEGAQDTLPEFLQEEILAADEPSKKNTENNPVRRHMKFCGGGSKPYKKK